jgi:flagellar biosynthesis protein FliP
MVGGTRAVIGKTLHVKKLDPKISLKHARHFIPVLKTILEYFIVVLKTIFKYFIVVLKTILKYFNHLTQRPTTFSLQRVALAIHIFIESRRKRNVVDSEQNCISLT